MTEYRERLNNHLGELHNTYFKVYQDLGATEADFKALLKVMEDNYLARKPSLKKLDHRPKDWYMSKDLVGMMIYVDLFADDLKGMIKRIPYLIELGISYVHLMPLLKPREGENDGGYAVEDYRAIDRRLGTMDDFVALTDAFLEAGIDICIDYVLNHTADTHEWARKALDGDVFFQGLFEMYDDRTIPDIYDLTVPEVLPDKCPGNFTYKPEIKKWVFTSFSDFQWDLNFKNPKVFELMTDTLLYLSNIGVNIIRLDAIPFMWKRVGTTCRNLPEVHDLMYLFHLIKEIVCPSLAILGEAIVEPDEIFKYFGTESKPECGILYNANFMVNIWNSLATRDVRLMNVDVSKYRLPNTGCWMNYARCHDDIGWGFNEDAIRSFGMDPFAHKQFLINFFSNRFDGSFARGEIYQYNPMTRDARTNGTLASLVGLEKAMQEHDEFARDVAIRRILLIHALIIAHQGIPLIYSGDELATLNDHSYLDDQTKKEEGRWVHRPYFSEKRASRRHDLGTNEGRVFQGIKQLIDIRKTNNLFDGNIPVFVVDVLNRSVYSFYKRMGDELLVCLFNFNENNQYISNQCFNDHGIHGVLFDLVQGKKVDVDQTIHLHPYEFLWLSYKLEVDDIK